MTTSFPLLKLPLIPLELIIENLHFLDLVQLSMKSSHFKRLLELFKLSVGFLNVRFTESSYVVSIWRNYNLSYIDACDSVPVNTVTEAVKIQEKPVLIWKDGRSVLKVQSNSTKLATLEAITKHVLSFSKVAKFYATLNCGQSEIRSLFIWQLTTQFDRLDISSNYGTHVPISPEDLAFILDGISINCLLLDLSLGPKTITAEFYDQKVSVDVLNRLIKDWTEGKNPKLRTVKFTWKECDRASLAMVLRHETQPPRPILPNRNVEQLKGLFINHQMRHWFRRQSVFYEVHLSVEEDFGLNGIHLEDQA